MKRVVLILSFILLLVSGAIEATAKESIMYVQGEEIKKTHVSTNYGGTLVVELPKVLNYNQIVMNDEVVDRIRETNKTIIIRCEDFSLRLAGNAIGGYGSGIYTIRVSRKKPENLPDYFTEKQMPGRNWETLSEVYSVNCIIDTGEEILFRPIATSVFASFNYDKTRVQNSRHVGLYVFDKSMDKWVYAGGAIDTNQGKVFIEQSLDSYFVFMEGESTITDVPVSHWGTDDIDSLAARAIISGDQFGRFNPSKEITRAEFAVMLCKAFGYYDELPKISTIGDITRDSWCFPYVYRVSHHHAMIGDSREWKPNTLIVREDLCSAIGRFGRLGIQAESLGYQEAYDLLTVKDRRDINYSNHRYVYVMLENGIISPREGGWFKANDTVTKAEAAVIIARALKFAKTEEDSIVYH